MDSLFTVLSFLANRIHIVSPMKAGRRGKTCNGVFWNILHRIRSDMVRKRLSELNQRLVNPKGRKYQMWKRKCFIDWSCGQKKSWYKVMKVLSGQVCVNILRNINIRQPCFTKQGLIIGDAPRIIANLIRLLVRYAQCLPAYQQWRQRPPLKTAVTLSIIGMLLIPPKLLCNICYRRHISAISAQFNTRVNQSSNECGCLNIQW